MVIFGMIRKHRYGLGRWALLCSLLIVLVGQVGSSLVASSATPSAQASSASPEFPGPAHGIVAGQSATAASFQLGCNAYVSTDAVKVNGQAIPIGAALRTDACGQAILLLNVPAGGHFQALVGMVDGSTTATIGKVIVRVLSRSGYPSGGTIVNVPPGSAPKKIDVDVRGAVALYLDYPASVELYTFNAKLTGSATLIAPATSTGSTTPVGSTPISISQVHPLCSANIPTSPISVTNVGLDSARSVDIVGCGSLVVPVASGSHGTLALRFGTEDTSSPPLLPTTVIARAYNGSGLLMHTVEGITFEGSGLRPMWLDLAGVRSIAISVSNVNIAHIAVTGLAFLPNRYPADQIAPRLLDGSGHNPAIIDPYAYILGCNAYVGTDDWLVNGVPLLANTYIHAPAGCGIANLIIVPLSHGRYHALFAVPDSAPVGTGTVQVVVNDRDAHPVFSHTYKAVQSGGPVVIDVPIDRGSAIAFTFTGAVDVLYNASITGQGAIYGGVYPPVSPPTRIAGGTLVKMADWQLKCNGYAQSDSDVTLVHEVALQQWTLRGEGCGEADLFMQKSGYPAHTFAARIGFGASSDPRAIARIQLNIGNARGHVFRTKVYTVRYGYGPQDISISLAGGTFLQVLWLDSPTVYLFAATTA